MNRTVLKTTVIFLLVIFSFSCRKIDVKEETVSATAESLQRPTSCDQLPTECEDCGIQEANENDSSELITILGGPINNPYSLETMRQAYNNIYGTNLHSIQPSHYYIKIDCQDINLLDELEGNDVELYDYPLNRHVIQEGDYWPAAYSGITDDAIPTLYAVIEKNYVMPPGINYEILEPLFIPDNNDALEDEAFYLTGNITCPNEYRDQVRPGVIEYYETHHMNPCDDWPSPCGGGQGGGVTPAGGGNRKPSGQINYKSYVSNPFGRIEADQPLKHMRIVGKRFFKIDKTFTDEGGNFTFTKSFPKKVTLVVKFRTSSYYGKHSIRQFPRTIGIWRSRFALKKNIGTYKGNRLGGLNYKFEKGGAWYRNKTRKWLAAVSLNSILDYDKFLSANGINKLPQDIRLYLQQSANTELAGEVNEFDFIRRSNAPCINQNRTFWQAFGNTSVNTVFLGIGIINFLYGNGVGGIIFTGAALSNMKNRSDISLHYATLDMSSMSSTKVALCVGQQLGIVYLNQMAFINGNTDNFSKYWGHIGTTAYPYTYSDYKPFGEKTGNGSTNSSNPELVAIWQMFAQHMAHSVIDNSYGNGAEIFKLQNTIWQSTASASSSKLFLEGFNPNPVNITDDYFSWIPVGLINDLMDTNIDLVGVTDFVSGLTYNNLYSIMLSQPKTMEEFRNAVINILPGQATQINDLFTSYGY